MSFDVARDTEGVRLALEEIFEEDFVRARIDRESAGDKRPDAETQRRMASAIPPRTLSPGYYRWADHLLGIESERLAGITFSGSDLSAIEVDGLVALDRARAGFKAKHPPCSACGTFQENRFGKKCSSCHCDFTRGRK